MLKKLKQIWKDQVFSNVIAFVLVALITLVYNLIIVGIKNISFKKVFIAFWAQKIELWIVLLFAIVFVGIYLIIGGIKQFKYDGETLKLDKDLFKQIREVHLTEEMMLAPKTFSFSSNPFLAKSLTALFKISEENKRSDFEFINPKLEKRKQKLINELDNLYSITCSYIFGTNNSGYLSIPSEWEFSNPERMDEAVLKISQQEKILSNTYDDLIKSGRRILKV